MTTNLLCKLNRWPSYKPDYVGQWIGSYDGHQIMNWY